MKLDILSCVLAVGCPFPIHLTSRSVSVCSLFSAQTSSWTWSPCQVPWLLKKRAFSKSKRSYYFFLGYVVPKPAEVLFQHLMYGDCCKSHVCLLFHADDNMLHGPVFLQEPSSVIFPLDSEEKKVKLNCEVKGNPRPTIGFVASFPVPLHIPYSSVLSSPPPLTPIWAQQHPGGGEVSLSADMKEKPSPGFALQHDCRIWIRLHKGYNGIVNHLGSLINHPCPQTRTKLLMVLQFY